MKDRERRERERKKERGRAGEREHARTLSVPHSVSMLNYYINCHKYCISDATI
jgi:hypothetical protein